MIDQITSTVLDYRVLFGLVTVAVVAYYVFDELLDADDRIEGTKNVGERIDDLFGGFLGAISATIVVLTSLTITLGDQVVGLVDALAGIAAGGPVVTAQLLTLGLGTISILGVVSVPASVFVAIGLAVLVAGVVARRRTTRA